MSGPVLGCGEGEDNKREDCLTKASQCCLAKASICLGVCLVVGRITREREDCLAKASQCCLAKASICLGVCFALDCLP